MVQNVMQSPFLYTMSNVKSGIDYNSEKIARDFKECIENIARKIAKEEIEKFKQEFESKQARITE